MRTSRYDMRRVGRAALGILCLWTISAFSAPIKVACVGDSITEGSGLSNPSVESWPAKLGKLLGAGYDVRNFGVSGRTLLKKGDFPYWNEAAFRNSTNANPDIVLIMLGTNDSKPQNWRYATNFVGDYQALISIYTNLASHPRIILCTPPPVFGSGAYSINPGIIRTNISPIVRDLGLRLDHEVLDLQVLLAAHKEWFTDTVHPVSRGTTVMAALIRSAIVGGYPITMPPQLEVGLSTNRVVFEWPLDWAGLVLESTTALKPTNSVWTVVEQVAGNDGTAIRVTNTVSGILRFYRLWQPDTP